MRLDEFKRKGFKRGDLVEITLSSNATEYGDGETYYLPDMFTNEPGRLKSGYYLSNDSVFVVLANEWDKTANSFKEGSTRIIYDFDVVESAEKKQN